MMPVMLVGIFGIAMVATSCKKKEGCTDPTACNYNAEAEKDDNSCEYESCVDDPGTGGGQTITITDDGSGTGTTTWTADNTYLLNGFVFVNSGQTLTIEAGTVIKGKPGTGANASALIVAQDGTIQACGTATNPIIFTAEADNLTGNIPVETRGLWGGVMILGNATLNSTPGQSAIEGIPTSEPRGTYGGNDDNDNSGSLCYVSIRHGGTDIGSGNEINGLTLGGVGSGTDIHHIEVVSNQDDGVEFFGGTVNTHHMITAFCGDDNYDYDEGFRGKGQFWVVIQDLATGDRGGEHDGGTTPETAMPYATPVIYNATYMGRGIAPGKRALTFRDNAGGAYHNSIFMDWGKGVDVENLATGEDSYSRFVAGDLALAGNVFYNTAVADAGAADTDLFKISMGSGWASAGDSTTELTASSAALQASFNANGNSVADPGLSNTFAPGAYDLIPTNAGNVSGGTAAADVWFEQVTYKGAFDPAATSSWVMGWTRIADYMAR